MIRVEVAYARPEAQRLIALSLSEDSTALEAIRESGIENVFPEIDLAYQSVGIFSHVIAEPGRYRLRDGDRVEIYRPLEIDPKEARAKRAGTRR
ncbi:RnfH family protein [Salicola sp. Rm-C-2C1-2]|uniref:RnfH family protein n=1 Tax=Salicola sp. Rm-C-2C1-2 TaxID=3141321 RepID=UPI0032E3A282